MAVALPARKLSPLIRATSKPSQFGQIATAEPDGRPPESTRLAERHRRECNAQNARGTGIILAVCRKDSPPLSPEGSRRGTPQNGEWLSPLAFRLRIVCWIGSLRSSLVEPTGHPARPLANRALARRLASGFFMLKDRDERPPTRAPGDTLWQTGLFMFQRLRDMIRAPSGRCTPGEGPWLPACSQRPQHP